MESFTIDPNKYVHFVIEKWQTEIIALGITDTRQLFNSFKAHIVRESNGKPELIKFFFEYYGKFLEMGVFGVGVGRNSPYKPRHRQKRPWYSRIFARQVRRLADLMAKQYGYQSVTTIAESVSENKKQMKFS